MTADELLQRHFEMLLGDNKSGDEVADLVREEECIDAWHALLKEKGCELIYVRDLRAGKTWDTMQATVVANPITMEAGDFDGGEGWRWPVFIVVPYRVWEELKRFVSPVAV
jgi:hypothetical protein